MIETHPNPKEAWSDSKQQVTPDRLKQIVKAILMNKSNLAIDTEGLAKMRGQVDKVDTQMLEEITKRMLLVKEIAKFKKENSATVFQHERWKFVLEESKKKAQELGLNEEFVEDLMNLIHKESLNIHHTIYNV
jgi:chorismate mutase